ncbi:hypothetical protein TRIUR3_30565 [Triticum urartu]|uniref:Uncharacterized protein n=1 Tax=Triticum urartu TaxID=4572 RepID=M7Z4F2_TRIUA|nr:hypothetical protein TRIUR3_30565 [Triticum urartu]
MADWWRRIVVIVVAVADDDNSAFVAAASMFRETKQGGTLALLRLLQVLLLHHYGVPARPFQGHFVVVELRCHRRGRLLIHRREPWLRLHQREPWLRLWLDEGADPQAFVSLVCKVFWPKDDDWYKGSITAYTELTKNFGYDELLALAVSFHDYQGLDPDNIAWAKIIGHAMWPVVIVDESNVHASRALKSIRFDQSILVQFFGTHDFARFLLTQKLPENMLQLRKSIENDGSNDNGQDDAIGSCNNLS